MRVVTILVPVADLAKSTPNVAAKGKKKNSGPANVYNYPELEPYFEQGLSVALMNVTPVGEKHDMLACTFYLEEQQAAMDMNPFMLPGMMGLDGLGEDDDDDFGPEDDDDRPSGLRMHK